MVEIGGMKIYKKKNRTRYTCMCTGTCIHASYIHTYITCRTFLSALIELLSIIVSLLLYLVCVVCATHIPKANIKYYQHHRSSIVSLQLVPHERSMIMSFPPPSFLLICLGTYSSSFTVSSNCWRYTTPAPPLTTSLSPVNTKGVDQGSAPTRKCRLTWSESNNQSARLTTAQP
jgi:hypothetical protein